jgi:hypothetical protein
MFEECFSVGDDTSLKAINFDYPQENKLDIQYQCLQTRVDVPLPLYPS